MATSYSTTEQTVTPTPQSDWQLELSRLLYNLGMDQYRWALKQYDQLSGITDDMINRYIQASDRALEMSGYDLARYRDVFQPLEDQLIAEAGSYASGARTRDNMGMAESGVMQAGERARVAAEKQLQSFGINPSSGRYADLIASQRTATAAAAAGAGQQARLATEQVGRNLRQQALAIGQQYPGNIVNSLNAAYTGVSGAQNAALGRANTGVNLTTSPAAFFNPAMQVRPPLVTTRSQSSGGGSPGGGGGGGQRQPQQQGGGGPQIIPDRGGGRTNYGGPGGLADHRVPPLSGRGGMGNIIKEGSTDEDKQYGDGVPTPAWARPYLNPETYNPSSPFTPPDMPTWGGDTRSWYEIPMAVNPVLPPGQIPGWEVQQQPSWATGPLPDYGNFQPPTPQGGWPQVPTPSWEQPQWPTGGNEFDRWSPGNDNWGFDYNLGDWSAYDPTLSGSGGADTLLGGGGQSWDSYGWGNTYDPTQQWQQPQSYDPSMWDQFQQPYDWSQQSYDWSQYQPPAQSYDIPYQPPQDYNVGYQDQYNTYDPTAYYDPYTDWGSGGDIDYGYAEGGDVLPDQATTGGFVSRHLSPSGGQVTDDIPARLNADEFVIPRDVAMWKGQEFFQKLIQQSRAARQGAPAKPSKGPPSGVQQIR